MGISKRNKYEIIYDILVACVGGSKKSWISRRAYLSTRVSKKYIDVLVRSGLLEVRDGMYFTTNAGIELINIIDAWRDAKKKTEELSIKLAAMIPHV